MESLCFSETLVSSLSQGVTTQKIKSTTYILIYFLLRFQKVTRVQCHERVAKVTGSGV